MSGIGSGTPALSKIFLAGFMGSGKSTIGPALAEALGWDFADTDRIIEQRARMSVAEIFQLLGEVRFRTMEATVIGELLNNPPPKQGIVVALGGGSLIHSETRERLMATGGVVYLKASVDALTSRLMSTARDRPLLTKGGGISTQPELRARVEEIFLQREPVYEMIPWKVLTDGRAPEEIVSEIVAGVPRERGGTPR